MPVKYIPYYPQPLSGQALLQNIGRTSRELVYEEDEKLEQALQRGMPYYEMEEREIVGDKSKVHKGQENMILRGEAISVCAYLKDNGIKVDLVYIDPPFASGIDYASSVHLRQNPDEISMGEDKGVEQKYYRDIWSKHDYLNWIYENLVAIKSIMSDNASIYVHLDWHIGHYVKVMMDEIFGEDNFINEIIWWYKGTGKSDKKFISKHDAIYFYAMNSQLTFNPQETAAKKISGWTGKSTKLCDDVWDIPTAFNSKERNDGIDYPTRKPGALLKRIIEASSNEGMIVADFFAGSGTTAKVAHELGRRFISSDVSFTSMDTQRDRIKKLGANFKVMDIKDGIRLMQNPAHTMTQIKKLIPNLLPRYEGMSDFWFGHFNDSKKGRVPVYIPNLTDHTQKVLDNNTMNRIIQKEIPNLSDDTLQKAVVYYIDIEDEDELNNFINEKNYTQVKIELKDMKRLLDEMVSPDEFEYKIDATKDGFVVTITNMHSDYLVQKIAAHNQKRDVNNTETKPIVISNKGLELIERVAVDTAKKSGTWHSDYEVRISKEGTAIIEEKDTKDHWKGTIKLPKGIKKPKRIKVRSIAGDETIVAVV